jgi:hypothetical protein
MLKKVAIAVLLTYTLVCVGSPLGVAVAQELPKLKTPVLITSCGQSPDAEMFRLMADRAGLSGKYTFELLADESKLKGMNTLVLVIGGSGKGLGAAGIDADFEVNRINKLIATARSSGATIVGVHIGGEARRGPVSEAFVPFAGECSVIIVREDGNEDGYFTNIAKTKGIPLVSIAKTSELVDILKTLFQ